MQGKTISGYTIKNHLGTGGMAEVWYAENKIGKKAAVKLLLPKLCQDENVVSRFLTEAKVMVELNHPNIRQVYDYGDIDGRPAIVMEYLDGSDLKARLKRGQRFTQEELVKWWNQLVDALNYTHKKGIVHRDIKPGNIFVDREGDVKLLDFGIAKVRDSISKTQTGQKLGTLMYMSPEQVKDSKHIDYRTDVYSLAVTFVHLITGKKPYDSDTSSDFEISEQIVYKPLDLRGMPEMWQSFLAPYLNKDPEQRPALRPFEAVVSDAGTDDEGTDVGDVPKKPDPPKQEPRKPKPEPKTKPESNNPKPKKGLWIGLGIAAAVFLLVLLLKPKPESIPTDPDTQAYEACQTVADYRAYMSDYGRNSLHYADAKAFVDQYVSDSIEQARQAQALADAAQKEEAERQAQAEAEKKEDEAYRKCTTIAACDSYLRTYPQGRYLTEVRAKKAELEGQEAEAKAEREAEQKEKAAYEKCTTIAACDSYLKFYPQGRYVGEVRAKKANLEAQAAQSSGTGTANGHEYNDLGLPSGTLWATCNMGASKPEDYGSYFAWGETSTKSTYNWRTYKYANGVYDKLTKYCNKSDFGNNGFTDKLTTLQAGDDPATAQWGSGWRTPSKAQWEELKNNTKCEWQKDKKGYQFTSKTNGNSVFLPAAGLRWDGELYNAGSDGHYWSRSLDTDYPYGAWGLYFNSGDCYMNSDYRRGGFSVRPVREK